MPFLVDGGSQTITLRQSNISARLDRLNDVVADSANTPAGSTLVYDPNSDKYVVKLLDMDGGEF